MNPHGNSENESHSAELRAAANDYTDGEPSDAILGYLACPQDAASGFIGALLITDARSRPLHFAYVSPIRPTAMQRLL